MNVVMPSGPIHLNLAEVCPDTRVLGPGRRYALWVQGCPFHCPGCLAPKWIPQQINRLTAVSVLVEEFLSIDGLEGVTVSGGEPMLQAAAIECLIRQIRCRQPAATLIVYTGYTRDELQSQGDTAQQSLLDHIDVLIDGRYEAALNDNRGLRGSSNQQVHFLSGAYRERGEAWFTRSPRQVEIHFRDDSLLMIGVPPGGLNRTIKQVVAAR